jgi:peptide/nickel transport system permease protein
VTARSDKVLLSALAHEQESAAIDPARLDALPGEESEGAPSLPTSTSPARGQRGRRRRNISLWLALGWLSLVVFVAVFAGLLPLRPYDVILSSPPARTAPHLSWNEPFGTDGLGRSTTSRLVYGARESLILGVFSAGIATMLALAIGMTAAYSGGKWDAAVSVFLDSLLAIPALVLLLVIAAVGRRNVESLIVGLAIVFTPSLARVARANTLTFVNREFVSAARAMGARPFRIVFRELLPNVIFPVSSYAFLLVGAAIVAEASLSFLGLGVPPPAPSWGGMVAFARPELQDHAFLVFVPAACLLFTVASFITVGDWARRRFDDKESVLL